MESRINVPKKRYEITMDYEEQSLIFNLLGRISRKNLMDLRFDEDEMEGIYRIYHDFGGVKPHEH